MINIRMHPKEVQTLSPKIIVVGVGGAGGNAVNNMINAGLDGVEFLVCNTDAQALDRSYCESKLQIGTEATGGLGAGAKPDVGREAAEESIEDVMRYLDGANMAFVTAGMGGGTGTGAAPIIAKAAREKGILTVGVVTKPFHFEGSYRMKMAEAGIEQMQDYVDTLIVIPNQNLFRIANEKTTFAEAFRMADSVLQSAVRGVTDLMIRPGDVNLDFADIRSVMLEMGKAMMGTGESTGEDRAERAAEAAINNPLLDDVSMKGARGVIINVTGGPDMTLFEVDQACNRIASEVDPNANIIFGSSFDESLDGVLRVSVVATGIDALEEKVRKVPGARNWNTSTNERRMERVQPNAESMAPAQSAVASGPTNYGQLAAASVQGFTGRAALPAPLARKLNEPAADMFDPSYMQGDVAGKKPEAAEAAASASLRGSVYNDAFIPPKAVEVDRPRPEMDYASPFGAQTGLSARRNDGYDPAVTQDVQAAPAPVPAMAAPAFPRPSAPQRPSAPLVQKSRTASLIDRITGSLRSHDVDADLHHIHESARESAHQRAAAEAPVLQGSAQSGLRAPSRTDMQGSLAIDAPSIKVDQAIDDELDIPAFLRRQAN